MALLRLLAALETLLDETLLELLPAEPPPQALSPQKGADAIVVPTALTNFLRLIGLHRSDGLSLM